MNDDLTIPDPEWMAEIEDSLLRLGQSQRPVVLPTDPPLVEPIKVHDPKLGRAVKLHDHSCLECPAYKPVWGQGVRGPDGEQMIAPDGWRCRYLHQGCEAARLRARGVNRHTTRYRIRKAARS